MLQDATTSHRGGLRLLVIGASASTLTLASHVLRRDGRARIVLIEARPEPCAALEAGAYADLLRHGLADATSWLPPEAAAAETHPLRLLRALAAHRDRLHVVQARCTAVAPTPQGVAVATDAGTTWLGHAAARAPASARVPSLPARRAGAAAAAPGAGRALRLDLTDIPLGTGAGYLARWLRATVRAAAGRGIPAAEVLAGVRLHAPEIWRHLPPRSRATFLRHGVDRWNRLVSGAPVEARPRRTGARAALPEGWDHAVALHPAELMPYAATVNLLDLDIACASLAERLLRGAPGLDRPAPVRGRPAPRARALS